jgi:prepilin-type N-terminal cleavage/methylation domain-containing protein
MKSQKGFTLMEMLLVTSITGAIVIVVMSSYVQIWKGRQEIAKTSIALMDIDRAAHLLTQDLVVAQTTNLTDGAAPVSSVNMTWNDLTHWAGDQGTVAHYATYTLSGTNLIRNYDGDSYTIARYMTKFNISINGTLFTVTVTSQPGFPGSAVTRSFSVNERTSGP